MRTTRKFVVSLGVWFATALVSPGAEAQVIPFSDQAAFQAALTESFTLANLDEQPLIAFGTPYNVEDSGPAAAFAQLGIDFRVFAPFVTSGQAFQITVPGRDRLIANGVGAAPFGNLIVDFVTPVDGFGVRSNVGDGGRIRAFSGPELGGAFLGEAALANGSFGGLVSSIPIASVEITCDFDSDLRCGLYDLQLGQVASPVPLHPLGGALLLAALALVASVSLRRVGAR